MGLTAQELKSSLRGIIGFGLTTFHRDFSLNLESLRQNASSLAESCEAVVPLAGNGEIYSLTPEEHITVGRAVVEEVHGRRPVIVGVGLTASLAAELARKAEAYGADGILILPPYFVHANDDGLFEYYRFVADATRLGVILFQTSAVHFSPSLLRRLAEVPNVVGLKDERGDLDLFVRQWAAVRERVELLCGVGEILAPSYFALGVKAFTSGLVNFMPARCRQLLDHLVRGEFEAAARLVERDMLAIYDLRVKRPGYRTLVIKEAMNLLGRNAGPARPPLTSLAEGERQELRQLLAGLGLV
jgi:5-dehydro-4-deoxyglucarate dehydratase